MKPDKLTNMAHFEKLEKAYIEARKREGRLLLDEEVRLLPKAARGSALFREWQLRAASLQKILAYIDARKDVCDILDFGCGNGWMSHRLFEHNYCVTGLDINGIELQQAKRLFEQPGLHFVQADIFKKPPLGLYDMIVVSAALQYFENANTLLDVLLTYLNPGGEIIIADTPFYREDELEKAAHRSKTYYQNLGVSKMSQFYFHHSQRLLAFYTSTSIYKPSGRTKLLGKLGVSFPAFPIYAIAR